MGQKGHENGPSGPPFGPPKPLTGLTSPLATALGAALREAVGAGEWRLAEVLARELADLEERLTPKAEVVELPTRRRPGNN